MRLIFLLLISVTSLIYADFKKKSPETESFSQLNTYTPLSMYQEAISSTSPIVQNKLLNEALMGYLNSKPQTPSAIWHFNVGCCFLALHSPGPAIFHFLQAKKIDPFIPQVDRALIRARLEANLPADVEDFTSAWLLPEISLPIGEIIFLVSCLSAFFVASLSLYLKNQSLTSVSKYLASFSILVGFWLLLRFMAPLEGVVVGPEKLKTMSLDKNLSRALLPGEVVEVLHVLGSSIQIKTAEGDVGMVSNKNCWIISVD